VHFNTNAIGSELVFRVDLPSAKSYNIRIAQGDTGNQNGQYLRLIDDATVFQTNSVADTGANEWFDANGVLRTSSEDWVNNNTPLEHAFTSTIFRVKMGGGGIGANWSLAHDSIEEVEVDAEADASIAYILPSVDYAFESTSNEFATFAISLPT